MVDVFDNNPYAHDPKNDFLNWTIIDMGSFDYAADAWGYTYGVSAELSDAASTVRAGLFQLSLRPNQIPIEPTPFRQFMPVVEYERKTSLFGGHPGSLKALAYADIGYMGAYADALAAARERRRPTSPPCGTTGTSRPAPGSNFSQEIATNLGLFARLSAMNGTYEAFEFTDPIAPLRWASRSTAISFTARTIPLPWARHSTPYPLPPKPISLRADSVFWSATANCPTGANAF